MSHNTGLSKRRVANVGRRTGSTDEHGDSVQTSDSSLNHSCMDKPNNELRSIDEYAPRLTLMEEVLLLGLKEKEGYLSFWNDSISYVLRGCILAELALRGRIGIVNEGGTHRRATTALAERPIEVLSQKATGEVLLDETLRIITGGEQASIISWIDFLSGETWNISKIGYQLKQVRERLAKGLVDKGVLRTEKRNFLLFDMATHPVQDIAAKRMVIQKCLDLVLARTPTISDDPAPDYQLRRVLFVCAAYVANVLENALPMLEFEAREACYVKADTLIAEHSRWPLPEATWKDLEDYLPKASLEVIAGVFSVYARMDSVF